MTRDTDRRQTEPQPGDAVSLDYLAMLEVCGGSVRDSDRPALERHVRERRVMTDRQIGDRRHEADRRRRERRSSPPDTTAPAKAAPAANEAA